MEYVNHKRVYYKDTDAGGVVYHTRYAEFLEEARSEMFREMAIPASLLVDRYQLIFPVVDLHLVYKKPAYYDDLLKITTKITKLSGVRVFFEYEIHDQAEKLCCKASSINCGIDSKNLKPLRLPREIFAVIKKNLSK